MIGDVRPDIRGIETWAGNPDGSDPLGLRSANGTRLSGATPGTNFSVRWAADGTTQIISGSGTVTPTQQTTYNQPSYPGFYLASDTVWADVPVPTIQVPVADE